MDTCCSNHLFSFCLWGLLAKDLSNSLMGQNVSDFGPFCNLFLSHDFLIGPDRLSQALRSSQDFTKGSKLTLDCDVMEEQVNFHSSPLLNWGSSNSYITHTLTVSSRSDIPILIYIHVGQFMCKGDGIYYKVFHY